MHYKKIIFCDFDGTITAEDTLEGFIQQFIAEDIRALGREMVKKNYTVKRGIKEMMAMIPSDSYTAGTEYFRHIRLREGFEVFLDTAEELVSCFAGLRSPAATSSGVCRPASCQRFKIPLQ